MRVVAVSEALFAYTFSGSIPELVYVGFNTSLGEQFILSDGEAFNSLGA